MSKLNDVSTGVDDAGAQFPPSAGNATGTRVAFVALVTGAVAMGVSPVFVRVAEVGPYASAFWRVFLALPFLWAWASLEQRSLSVIRGWSWPIGIAGVLFAGDLIFWHLAIIHTSIANATFLATLAPVWVLLGSHVILREPTSRNMWIGLLACLLGAGALVGANLGIAPERLLGDVFGLITSVFFGAYILATRYVRRSLGPGGLMFRSSLVTAVALFVAAVMLDDGFIPGSWQGGAALVALALLAHAAGQGLLAFSLGRLTAGFSALVIFLEALTAAVFAWFALGEALTILQIAGGLLILTGIWIARPGKSFAQ
ncbi:DMT family transporter [Roseibium sp.]|uniref:DMT family transporter n=1 Tax=Roseibium sp. TaxID=1936156 RepID=UPI003A97AFDC